MQEIIQAMMESADKHKDYEMADFVYKLLSEFANTVNCPSDWQVIGDIMAENYNDGWIYENCKLYDFQW